MCVCEGGYQHATCRVGLVFMYKFHIASATDLYGTIGAAEIKKSEIYQHFCVCIGGGVFIT